MGDAVVFAVEQIGRFASSRQVLNAIRDYAPIVMEPDERQRRRKISQALYTTKGDRLVSLPVNGKTMWGKPEWTDGGRPKDDYLPLYSDVEEADDDESY